MLSPYSVTSAADDGSAGTLRAAIIAVNASPSSYTGTHGNAEIDFNIAGSGVHTINLTSALPVITADMTIDGLTQPGSSVGTPLIQLNGAGAGSAVNGLDIQGSLGNVNGLIISGFSQAGILLESTAVDTFVSNCFIGTNASGTAAQGNGTGIDVASNNNIIGINGLFSGGRNVVSGNSNYGVVLESAATGNNVQGNYIGTNAAGTAALGNGLDGLIVDGNSNFIGATTAGYGNVVSGNNGGYGVAFLGTGNTVLGNSIGTNAAGSSALANQYGIVDNANSNTIGGTTTAARNIVSGNTLDGIVIDSPSNSNLVEGNYVGLSGSGSALGNGTNGIEVFGSSNLIGNTTAGAGNSIANNGGDGILLDSTAQSNTLEGNSILSNGFNGVEVFGMFNNIGSGTTATARNVISLNTQDGILVDSGAISTLVTNDYIGTDSTGNSAQGNGGNGIEVNSNGNFIGAFFGGLLNVISGNGQDGVLLASGVTGNAVAGNNIGTNAASTAALANGFSGIEDNGSTNTIGGTTSAARNVVSGNLQDGILIDSGSAGNLIEGNFVGAAPTGTAALGNNINGIEVLGFGNTIGGSSSAARNVISNNLQDGILLGNNAASTVIQSNYIGVASDGVHALGNSGNGIEVAVGKNTIGGTTAAARNLISSNVQDGILVDSGVSGVSIQDNYIGTNYVGNAAMGNSGNGVEIAGSGNTVGGLTAGQRNLISGNGQDGVLIDNAGPGGNWVQGNYIGVRAVGNVALGNSGNGVEFDGANNTLGGTTASARNVISGNFGDGVLIAPGASGSIIQSNLIGTDNSGKSKVGNFVGVELDQNGVVLGGSTAASRNVISGNLTDGVLIDSGITGDSVQANYIGTNIQGTAALGNSIGVEVAGNSNSIGGTMLGMRNVISGNSSYGVLIDAGSSSNSVQGNYIGVNVNGAALGNSSYGVSIAGSNTLIGGTSPAASNTIAYNSTGGINVSGGSDNTIRRNSIFANGASQTGPGIVLASGANNNLAAPTLTTAALNGTPTTLTITGSYTAPTAGVPYVLEFFASVAGDPEGRVYLGKLTVTPSTTGTQSFTAIVSTSVTGTYPFITATLTDNLGDTSAFSNGVTRTT